MSDNTRGIISSHGWQIATAVHISGVAGFATSSLLDRLHMPEWMIIPLAYRGLLTLLIGPAAILVLIAFRRITGWQIPAAIAVACAIEFSSVLAMKPLIR